MDRLQATMQTPHFLNPNSVKLTTKDTEIIDNQQFRISQGSNVLCDIQNPLGIPVNPFNPAILSKNPFGGFKKLANPKRKKGFLPLFNRNHFLSTALCISKEFHLRIEAFLPRCQIPKPINSVGLHHLGFDIVFPEPR